MNRIDADIQTNLGEVKEASTCSIAKDGDIYIIAIDGYTNHARRQNTGNT